ncbi:MAG: hypothetical protein AAB404_02445 [Patescibacteria group bacterium]
MSKIGGGSFNTEIKEKIVKFEHLLTSYAKFRNRPRGSIAMKEVEKIFFELVEKKANQVYSDRIIVALAGAAGDFIGSELADGKCFDCHRTRKAISESAEWLISGWINPCIDLKTEGESCLSQAIEKLLSYALRKYFSLKPAEDSVLSKNTPA